MTDAFSRVKLMLGEAAAEKLSGLSVAVFGLGGVGGYVAEALCRSGVKNIVVVDGDTVEPSNLNRQIIATVGTIGQFKTEAVRERMLTINPDAGITCRNVFITADNIDGFDFSGLDYIVDAVDTVAAKVSIAVKAKSLGIPVISCMGTGGKLNPSLLKVSDIYETENCPLARVMRRELRKRGIEKLKVVWSPEPMRRRSDTENDGKNHSDVKADGKAAPPSMIFVPAAAGLLIAAEIVKDVIGD